MTEQQPEDEALVRQMASGDSRAFEVLYGRYARVVEGFAFKILGDHDAAEEVVQDTFWRLWHHASSFHADRGSVTAWMFGIARHLAFDELRRRRVHPTLQEGDEPFSSNGAQLEGGKSGRSKEHERLDMIVDALEQLPWHQRRVIELAYLDGLTHREIAELLEKPLGTIHTRVRLALKKLRELLTAGEGNFADGDGAY